MIRESLLFLGHEFQSQRVTVVHHPASDLDARVVADRTQLQQVVVNLAVNAGQALAQSSAGERKIVFRTICDGALVRCTVEDSGPGIAAEHAGRLFQSFFTTKEDGMGMGLPICRSIVEAHGGTIHVDGESMLGGARFTFALPAAD